MSDGPDYQLEAKDSGERLTLTLTGRVDVTNAQHIFEAILEKCPESVRIVDLDLGGVTYFDSGGGAILLRLRQVFAERGATVNVVRPTPDIAGFLRLIDQDALLAPAKGTAPSKSGFIERIGAAGLEVYEDFRDQVEFSGELVLGLVDAVKHPQRVRWADTLVYMERCGIMGLPIVALISYLMGLITAFQAAIQLTQFGADIYVANLVGLSIVRELGPLMTAIIAAGRSGAAFAAEIGTMKVSDEVDALETMGLDRTRFLVTPKVIALVLMLPCLVLFADVVGMLGGLTVGVFFLDLPATAYLRQTQLWVHPWDIISGLIKSVAFALLIATVGCLRGFRARGGAASVGQTTTSAIVASIFFIILADAVFTVLFNYW